MHIKVSSAKQSDLNPHYLLQRCFNCISRRQAAGVIYLQSQLFVCFQEVMRITREFAVCKGCCWCADGSCGFRMDVQAPVGNHIGYIRQK